MGRVPFTCRSCGPSGATAARRGRRLGLQGIDARGAAAHDRGPARRGRLRVRAGPRRPPLRLAEAARAARRPAGCRCPTPTEALAATGYERGAITPFGASRAWPVILDASAADRDRVRHRRRGARRQPAPGPGRPGRRARRDGRRRDRAARRRSRPPAERSAARGEPVASATQMWHDRRDAQGAGAPRPVARPRDPAHPPRRVAHAARWAASSTAGSSSRSARGS